MAAGAASPTAPAVEPGPPVDEEVAVPLLAALGLIALVACVLIADLTVVSRREETNQARAQAVAERQAGLVAVQLQEIETAVTLLDTADCPRPDELDGVRALACVDLDEDTVPGAEHLGPVLADPALRSALAQARDRSVPVLSPPVGPDPPSPLVVGALYAAGEGALTAVPSERTVTVARDEVAGFVVAVLDVGALVATSPTPVTVTDAGSQMVVGTEADESAGADLAALGRQWTVSAPVEPLGWWRPAVVAVTTLGALAALLLGLADRRRRRILRAHAAVAGRAEQRAAALRTLAGVVQQSQDLDEILPSLTVLLSDELHLVGLSLAVTTGPGREREVFTHGLPPDRSVAAGSKAVDRVAAGQTLAFDLHRADRSIGTLRVLAGAPLDPSEVDLVRVAGEMVTSTVVSARSLEQQQEAVSRLEALDELKTTFLGVASHELRTPATAISGLATLLAQRWDTLGEGERRGFAQRIATNADALGALVQDLLDFARLERGDLRLVLSPVDLSVVVDGVIDRLESVWSTHGVVREIAPEVTVLGDVSAIERILTNLVANAVKFSPAGAPVTVRVEGGADRARLVVDDQGPGVPPEEREKIFVRFFRGTGDAVVRTRGVGIGLSVVQDFVAQMGGDVVVEDSPEGGARFVVTLNVCARSMVEERDVAST